MYHNLATSLDRVDTMLEELKREYEQSLVNKIVTDKSMHLTHELLEKLRGILDRSVRRYWDLYILPNIEKKDAEQASVYYPVSQDQHSFDSIMGRWRWRSVKENHNTLYEFLKKTQPFINIHNQWLEILNNLAIKSKHIDLVPQKRIEDTRISIQHSSGSSISWSNSPNSTVRFNNGPGVQIKFFGQDFNPQTQRVSPHKDITQKTEIWVSFIIEGENVNALEFCTLCCQQVRRIVTKMSNEFSL